MWQNYKTFELVYWPGGYSMNTNQTYHFSLSFEKANMILAGLGELPAKASFDLICELRDTIIAQSTPVAPNANVAPINPAADGVLNCYAGQSGG